MKPFEKILITTDGSDNAKAAVTQGLALAKLMNAEVTAVSIVDIGSIAYAVQGLVITDIYTYLEEGADANVDQVRQEGKSIGVVVKMIVKNGVPANDIIDMSKDYDLIVMGTLGLTGLSHLLIGSVAEKVVRFASCAVLVIRDHKAS